MAACNSINNQEGHAPRELLQVQVPPSDHDGMTQQGSTNRSLSTSMVITTNNEAYATSIVTENNTAYARSTVNKYLTLTGKLYCILRQIRLIIVSMGILSGSATYDNYKSDNHRTQLEEEDTYYVVPACDECSLCKQLSKFKIQNIPRDAIRYT